MDDKKEATFLERLLYIEEHMKRQDRFLDELGEILSKLKESLNEDSRSRLL